MVNARLREKEAKSGLRRKKQYIQRFIHPTQTLNVAGKIDCCHSFRLYLLWLVYICFFFLFIFCSSNLILILWIDSTTFLSGSETDCDGFRCYCYICFNFYLISIFILTWWCYRGISCSLIRSVGRSVCLSVAVQLQHTHNSKVYT